MKAFSKVVALVVIALISAACGAVMPAKPMAIKELDPPGRVGKIRNTDSTKGILINEGGTFLDIVIKDEARRPIMVIENFPPARTPIPGVNLINNIRVPARLHMSLPPGNYSVDYIAFYFTPEWFRWFPIFISGWYRVDRRPQSASISVGLNPAADYDERTGRNIGWSTRLNGGDIPSDPIFSNIKFNFSCC